MLYFFHTGDPAWSINAHCSDMPFPEAHQLWQGLKSRDISPNIFVSECVPVEPGPMKKTCTARPFCGCGQTRKHKQKYKKRVSYESDEDAACVISDFAGVTIWGCSLSLREGHVGARRTGNGTREKSEFLRHVLCLCGGAVRRDLAPGRQAGCSLLRRRDKTNTQTRTHARAPTKKRDLYRGLYDFGQQEDVWCGAEVLSGLRPCKIRLRL